MRSGLCGGIIPLPLRMKAFSAASSGNLVGRLSRLGPSPARPFGWHVLQLRTKICSPVKLVEPSRSRSRCAFFTASIRRISSDMTQPERRPAVSKKIKKTLPRWKSGSFEETLWKCWFMYSFFTRTRLTTRVYRTFTSYFITVFNIKIENRGRLPQLSYSPLMLIENMLNIEFTFTL